MMNMTLTLVLSGLLLLWLLTQVKAVNTPPDSELKRRALLNGNEQLLYNRLQDILPNSHIMAHVCFDALLTTKLSRTRSKYQNMMADFVVLDVHYQVLAVVGLSDVLYSRRQEQELYQDQLLLLAGYRVLRYVGVPEYQNLRADFKQYSVIQSTGHTAKSQIAEFQVMAKPYIT